MAHGRRLAAMGAAVALTVVLAQHTTTASFAGQTSNTGDSVAAAADFCTAPTRVDTLPNATYTAVDTGLNQSAPGQNYVSNQNIGVIATSGSEARSLIKFTLAPKPAGCVVATATLKLHVSSQSGAATVNVYRAAAPWTPGSVTWSSDPGYLSGTVAPAAATGTGTVTSWNVLTLVNELYTGPDNGFELRDAAEGVGSGSQLYDSLDSTTASFRPQLVITWN